jgi:hypothetical protein
MIKDHFYQSWYRLEDLIDREYFKDPHLGLRIAGVDFQEPYLRCQETTIIALAVMRLLPNSLETLAKTLLEMNGFIAIHFPKLYKRRSN